DETLEGSRARMPPIHVLRASGHRRAPVDDHGRKVVGSLTARPTDPTQPSVLFTPHQILGDPISAAPWSVKDSEKLYNMQGWGQGFFRINPEGNVSVHTDPANGRELDLFRLALDLNAQGVQLPLLIRFSDILRSRIERLATEFRRAIDEFGYEGNYTTVYPIKVNQQRHVVEEIVEFGTAFGVGLECGSKAEL